MTTYHTPALLNEVITGLNIQPGGVYVDATFGGGGHTRAILENLTNGKVIAFDQDEDAIHNLPDDPRFIFVQHNFRYLKNFLRYYQIQQVDGILADLGISSHQIDEWQRGFSFRANSELDMRMNKKAKLNAQIVLNEYSEDKLADIFYHFGELRNARALAHAIVENRSPKKILTVNDLISAVEKLFPRHETNKWLAKIFQAIRIEVNDELGSLKDLLKQSVEVLKPGGRLVIISYHSLEDRLVKNFIRSGNFEGIEEKDFYGNIKRPFKAINKNVIVPTAAEIAANNRVRSAKLRIAEKV